MSLVTSSSHVLYREVQNQVSRKITAATNSTTCFVSQKSCSWLDTKRPHSKNVAKRDVKVEAFWPDLTRPSSIEMEPIKDNDQLDEILAQAQQLSQPIIIDWMASWCRKCIYLKPKLEKLAAEYDTKLKFYCVDVNKVPQSLVKRGNITKMPTIQLWKDGEMKEEVIGGHKAWLVVEEIKQMIQKFI